MPNDETKELREHFDQSLHNHEEKDFAFYREIRKAVASSGNDLQGVQKQLASFTLAGRILWGIGFLAVAGLGTVLGILYSDLNHLESTFHEVAGEKRRNEAIIESNKSGVRRLDADIRDLRNRIGVCEVTP